VTSNDSLLAFCDGAVCVTKSKERRTTYITIFKENDNILSNYGDLLNVEDLSTIFGVSKNTIYKSVNDGKFGTPIQIGRAYKIPKVYVIKKFFKNYS